MGTDGLTNPYNLHEQFLKQILFGLFESPFADVLGFKGGSLLYFCYALDRFSTDLDVDLLDFSPEEEVIQYIDTLLPKVGEVKSKLLGKNLHRWVFRYDEKSWNIKIELNKRLNPHNRYEITTIEGHQIQSMNRTSLASNKLLALSNRRYNRDLYDVHFLLSKGFPFDDEIIFHESKKSIKELMKYILTNVQTYYDTTTILHELSMVINDKQKARVKSHLLNETITLLEKYIASH